MAKLTLAELRAELKKKNENKGGNFTENNDVYPHWNIDVDSSCTVRLLADKNEDNPNHYYVEKFDHKLSINGKDRKVLCMRTWGEKCPICELSSKYYKSEGKESALGKYYWNKKVALAKALILKDPISKDGHENAVGSVKTLQLSTQITKNMTQQLANEDEETALAAIPWDNDEGHNLIIKKTNDGKWDSYSVGTGFSPKVTAIAEEYLDAVEEGVVDLKTLLPENPGVEKIQALLDAHLGAGDGEDEEEEAAPAPRRAAATSTEDDAAPVRRRPAPAAAAVEEEEAPPVRRRVVEEAAEEEAAPPRRRVVEETAEEEAPPVRRRAAAAVEEAAPAPKAKEAAAAPADDIDEEEAAMLARIQARRAKAAG